MTDEKPKQGVNPLETMLSGLLPGPEELSDMIGPLFVELMAPIMGRLVAIDEKLSLLIDLGDEDDTQEN